ncbi:MAG: DNA internalization-related competence protein ComEC/Rec2 [Planctomycetaceae bacterium]|nr:DNA internalization-related competence protein ComEC/Rec2 [Planctomycetaceae bacterium]
MDEIQQKIDDFKKSLESPSPLKETFLYCPAVLPVVGLLCGLAVQFYFNMPSFIYFAVLVIAIILYLGRHTGLPLRNNPYLILICVFLCFCCLGAIRLTKFNMLAKNDIRNVIKEPTFAHLKGQIISKPVIVENNDWHFAKFYPSLTYTTFLADVTDIKTETGWAKVTGKIKFYTNEPTNRLNIGDKFQTFCRFEEFSPPDNPGQFNVQNYMMRNGIFLCASVKSVNSIAVYEKQNIKSGLGIKSKLNSLASAWLNDNPEDQRANLVEALVLGSRTKIDRKLYGDFINTGLVHLVCISGLNVGIFAAVAGWISKRAGLLHKGRAIACIVSITVFLLVVPAQSPILRAGIMFIIFYLARLINRNSFSINNLAISALVLLLIRPMDFLTPSFQLSFMAVLGILLFYEPIDNFFKPVRISPWLKWLLSLLSVGFAAWIAVAPIIAFHYYQLQLFAPIWTVPASIPTTFMIVLGTFKIIITPLLPSVGIIIGYVLNFSAAVLSYLVTVFAKVPFSNITIGGISISFIFAFYALLFLWKFLPHKKFIYPSAMIILVTAAVIFVNHLKKQNQLQIAVLSVGHGQCCILTPSDSSSIIIDAGSITKANLGEKIINPYLNYSAISKIDSVFISHDDIDHFNGLPEISGKRPFANVYTTNQLISSTSNTAIELQHIYNLMPTPEKIQYGNFAITRLWPKDIDTDLSDNESSLVLLAEYHGRKILFCSDITADVQNQIMTSYPQLDIDVLITPHHGSARTTDNNFISFFKPEYLITSSGDTDFGRTSAAIRDFKNSFYTFADGSVFVKIDSKGTIKLSSLKKPE